MDHENSLKAEFILNSVNTLCIIVEVRGSNPSRFTPCPVWFSFTVFPVPSLASQRNFSLGPHPPLLVTLSFTPHTTRLVRTDVSLLERPCHGSGG